MDEPTIIIAIKLVVGIPLALLVCWCVATITGKSFALGSTEQDRNANE